MTAYEKFNKRLILPYQFALEYSRNRTKVVNKQISNFQQAEKTLNELRDRHRVKSEQPHLSKRSMEALEVIFKELAEGRAKMEKSMASDEESDLLLKLFDGKIGVEPTADELKSFYSEGKTRYDANIPPGFEDLKEKGEPDCYADFIAWKQIMAIASDEKKDFILVTDDVKKDWWHNEGSRSVGPLPALRKEFRDVTGQSIWLYTSEGFLRDAKEFSQVKVGDVALSEVKAALDTQREDRMQRSKNALAKLERDKLHAEAVLRRDELEQLRQELERSRAMLGDARTEDRERMSRERIDFRLRQMNDEIAYARGRLEALRLVLDGSNKTDPPEHRDSDDDVP